ncbi:hypothetical protein [Ehrlichia canis]|uniref:Uncharacterized protein n=1 Tax=Ehrlichia canis (strain Jake) TaxID=269484 RepID=A0ACA6AVZ3_EHRCJ|nr:hypothetical protein [Ehrlichia canis]AAZ68549.1 hypothetical protein Ecaj_0513 [Ehrlichia canis str. Jake]AUO54710.1 hypothetical protein C1I72_02255 [Ehrlichia canis]UKC53363.1 hypothetical protein s20019040002_000406 [Ehrlichia canis]UKC54299.1 hypothetical protein s20026770001_000405 [Ehrlichia canis]UKC55235.1 hypothetical protein s21009500007_000405 [Ehrlichia canis]
MPSAKKLIARAIGLVIGSLLLIFSFNILMRYFSKKVNSIFLGICLLLSIGITVFFKIYGIDKTSSTFINLKIYGMLVSSALIMFCIANLILKKSSECSVKLSKQNKQIYYLNINLDNLKIELNIIKREIEWYFTHLCNDDKIYINIEKEHLVSTNKKYYDLNSLCKVVKLITFIVALLIFLYQFFYSCINQKFRSVELNMYYALLSLFFCIFMVDKLPDYYYEYVKTNADEDNKNIIDSLNNELRIKTKLRDSLLKEVSAYNNTIDDESLIGESDYQLNRQKILKILNRI